MTTIFDKINDLYAKAAQLNEQAAQLLQLMTELKVDVIMHEKLDLVEPDAIKEKVQELFEIKDVTKRTRKREIVYARHAAAFLMKSFTSQSLSRIALQIGQTDHTSARHSIQACKDLMDTDFQYNQQLQRLVAHFQILSC